MSLQVPALASYVLPEVAENCTLGKLKGNS
jgi:hypothetical protein